MWKEFKEFIFTGNVIDFAIVQDIIMPIVGNFAGGYDFADLKHVLSPAELGADGAVVKPENAIRYGAWFNSIINLLIVGMVLFWLSSA